ncbi:MAG: hypothetical protein GXX89_09400 [Clostridiales bacterium]|jgi:hypothetical protein|nr:hypothetical protein [Clostridiales bacterium]
MAATYEQIIRFMEEYFPAYSEQGQIEETQSVMDRFYAPDIKFDDGVITSRDQWYKACLSHPGILDKITPELIYADEKQQTAGALVTARAVETETGNVLSEIKMNAFYQLATDGNGELKIKHVRVFLESDPKKAERLMKVFGMKM